MTPDSTPILEGLAEAGVQMFHYGYETKPEYIKEKIGDRVNLMGNVPPLTVLRNGTPEDVDLAVKDVIAKSARGGGLVVAAGGYIDEGTPMENVEAMIRACEKYGKRDDVHRLAADFYKKMAAEARETGEPEAAAETGPIGVDQDTDPPQGGDCQRTLQGRSRSRLRGLVQGIVASGSPGPGHGSRHG